jgi:hypothetical protein
MHNDYFVYNKAGHNETLQAVQHCLVESMAQLGDPSRCTLPGQWTGVYFLGKGDWKWQKEWLQMNRSYSNLGANGQVCPYCFAGGSADRPWVDPFHERFACAADRDLALQTSALARRFSAQPRSKV